MKGMFIIYFITHHYHYITNGGAHEEERETHITQEKQTKAQHGNEPFFFFVGNTCDIFGKASVQAFFCNESFRRFHIERYPTFSSMKMIEAGRK